MAFFSQLRGVSAIKKKIIRKEMWIMEIIDLSFNIFVLLFVTGFCSGFVDSIAGGGGLIALPVLLFMGLPPQVALGTNKLQGSFGTFSASYNYLKNGNASLKGALPGIIFTFAGSLIGAFLVQILDASVIEPLIPILLLMVLIYTFFSKNIGFKDRPPIMGESLFYLIFGFLLGFYDGFFGPGTGSLWTAAFMVFLGFNMAKSTGYTKLMNFTSNIVSLLCFAMGNNIIYCVGFTMAAGQILGARIGSGMAIKRGAVFIRPVFLTIVFLTILRLLYLRVLNLIN